MSVIFEYPLHICPRGVMFAIVVKEANRIHPISQRCLPHLSLTDINPVRADPILPMLIQTLRASTNIGMLPVCAFQDDQEGKIL
jgi:hypothetical protein